jgi:integrase
MSVHQLPDGRWIVKIPDKDKASGSRREYFGRGPKAELQARSRDKSLDLKRTRPRADDTGPLFADIAIAYISARNFQSNSYKWCTYVYEANILPALGNISAINLTYDDLDRYVQSRRKTVKASTVRRELSTIQAAMNWAVKRRPPMISLNPISGYPLPKIEEFIIYPPTKDEILLILENANDRLRRAIIISWYTGLRPGDIELLSLRWESVSFDSGSIRVTSARKGGVRMRDVPIHPEFMLELRKWKEHDDAEGITSGNIIYKGPDGKPIHSILRAWHRAKKKAGITRRIRMYDMRHFFVTSAIEAGADYKTLSDIVGSDPETLRRHYQHVSVAARKLVIDRMPALS